MKPAWASKEVELDHTAFEEVRHKSELRVVFLGDGCHCPEHRAARGEVYPPHPTQAASETDISHTIDGDSTSPVAVVGTFTVLVKTLTAQKPIAVRLQLDATTDDLKSVLCNRVGMPKNEQRLIFNKTMLADTQTLKSFGIISDSRVHLVCRVRGGKPAIFILSPCTMPEVNVTISLSEQWRLTDLFPPTDDDTTKSHVASAHWRVMVRKNGRLYDHATGIRTPYLFWEAETAAVPRLGDSFLSGFNPLAPELAPPNSTMMPMSRLIPYLSEELETLFMNTTMRADFITYWIRDFRELETQDMDIAFTFVKQSDYEEAAQLHVDPKPDVVVRVFMIFGGVKRGTDSHTEWSRAATQNTPSWRDVVGVNQETADLMEDESRYRVLEWGGMRVVPAELPVSY